MWTVSRQCQHPEGDLIVEISQGGIDFCNPDAFSPMFDGELKEYSDPREAVETAIAIAEQWQKTIKDKDEIFIGRGATGGMTMPFDGEPLTEETFASLRAHAEDIYEKLPKCDNCGGLIGKEKYHLEILDHTACSEFCAVMICAELEELQEWEEEQDEEQEDPVIENDIGLPGHTTWDIGPPGSIPEES